MKKILFLLVLSATIFPEVALATETPQLQQAEQKFDDNRILEELRELGIDASEDSYSDLLKNETYRQRISEKIKELEQQVNSIVNDIRNKQINYESERTEQLRTNLINELDQAIKMLDSKDSVKVFDIIRSFIPSDKYDELEPIILKIIIFQDDAYVLNLLTEPLEKTLSEESMGEALQKMGEFIGPCFSRLMIKNSPEKRINILERIVDESALSEADKKACLDTLDKCNKIISFTKREQLYKDQLTEEENCSEILMKLCETIEFYTDSFAQMLEYSDTENSLNELKERSLLTALKFRPVNEKMIKFPYLKSDVIRIAEDELYLQAGLFMLGQDLANLLNKLASASVFEEVFTRGNYDVYCNKVDNINIFNLSISLKKFPEFSGAYESIENSVRSSFVLLEQERMQPIIKSVRIFALALRDIVRYNSDIVVKKQAIKRALAVLKAFGQTVPSLEEEVKDVSLDLDETQQRSIENLMKNELSGISNFSKLIDETGVEKNATPFLEELKKIVIKAKHRFFEENKTNFNSILKITSELLEERKVENEKDSKDLQNKVVETKNILSQMTYDEIFSVMYPQKLGLRFSLSESRIEALQKAGILDYQLNENTDLDEVQLFLESKLMVRFYYGTINYLLELAERRISLVKMLKSYDSVPQIIYNGLFSGLDKLSEEGMRYYLNIISSFSDIQPELYQQWSRELNLALPMLRELDTLRSINSLVDKDIPVPLG